MQMKPKPAWLKVRAATTHDLTRVAEVIEKNSLHTVCQEAGCPNIFECFAAGTATFLILGDSCTRACTFCRVGKGHPQKPDETEPQRVAEAISALELTYAVITSVTRDDLPNGGASVFAAVVREIKRQSPPCQIELLIPDFGGGIEALETVVKAAPDVVNHNVETVPRLYPTVRPQASYRRSLELLSAIKKRAPSITTKSGVMVGLGEQFAEVEEVLRNLRSANCDRVTIGQYLAPSPAHAPIERYYEPSEFRALREFALALGFEHVDSAPLVRSSYKAEDPRDGKRYEDL